MSTNQPSTGSTIMCNQSTTASSRKTCIVRGCKTTNELFLHRLPSCPAKAALWLEAMGRNDLLYVKETNNLRICQCHFTDKQYTSTLRKRLHRLAIPDVPLGEKNLEQGQGKTTVADFTQPPLHALYPVCVLQELRAKRELKRTNSDNHITSPNASKLICVAHSESPCLPMNIHCKQQKGDAGNKTYIRSDKSSEGIAKDTELSTLSASNTINKCSIKLCNDKPGKTPGNDDWNNLMIAKEVLLMSKTSTSSIPRAIGHLDKKISTTEVTTCESEKIRKVMSVMTNNQSKKLPGGVSKVLSTSLTSNQSIYTSRGKGQQPEMTTVKIINSSKTSKILKQTTLKQAQSTIIQLQKKVKRLQNCLLYNKIRQEQLLLKKMTRAKTIETVIKDLKPLLPEGLFNFVCEQLNNFDKGPQGRRWSEETKKWALSIHTCSPVAYRTLRKVSGLTLPSVTTLGECFNKICDTSASSFMQLSCYSEATHS